MVSEHPGYTLRIVRRVVREKNAAPAYYNKKRKDLKDALP